MSSLWTSAASTDYHCCSTCVPPPAPPPRPTSAARTVTPRTRTTPGKGCDASCSDELVPLLVLLWGAWTVWSDKDGVRTNSVMWRQTMWRCSIRDVNHSKWRQMMTRRYEGERNSGWGQCVLKTNHAMWRQILQCGNDAVWRQTACCENSGKLLSWCNIANKRHYVKARCEIKDCDVKASVMCRQ